MYIELNREHEEAIEFAVRVIDSYFYNYQNMIPEQQEFEERASLSVLEDLLYKFKKAKEHE